MVRTTVVVRRVAMARQDDFRLQFQGTGMGRVKIINFKPKQNAIPMREVWVTDPAMMMRLLPAVQLKDQPPA